jgi:hypothetical protein
VQLYTYEGVYRLLRNRGQQPDNGLDRAGDPRTLLSSDSRNRIYYDIQRLRKLHRRSWDSRPASVTAATTTSSAAATSTTSTAAAELSECEDQWFE